MSTRADLFERAWNRIESGAEPVEVLNDDALPAGVADKVAAAVMVRSLSGQIETPPADQVWNELVGRLEQQGQFRPAGGSFVHRVLQPDELRPRRALRAVLVAAACLAVLAGASLRAAPGSPLYFVRTSLERVTLALAPDDGTVHARIALGRVGDLLYVLEHDAYGDATELAQAVLDERAAAIAEGADVSEIDLLLATQVSLILNDVPEPVALEIRAILGWLLVLPPGEPWVPVGDVVDPGQGEDPAAQETDPWYGSTGDDWFDPSAWVDSSAPVEEPPPSDGSGDPGIPPAEDGTVPDDGSGDGGEAVAEDPGDPGTDSPPDPSADPPADPDPGTDPAPDPDPGTDPPADPDPGTDPPPDPGDPPPDPGALFSRRLDSES